MSDDEDWHKKVDAALTRMRKAVMAGKGVRISADELAQLNLTVLGELMAQYEEPQP